MSEALKVNTTLVTLDLAGAITTTTGQCQTMTQQQKNSGNEISADEVRELSEALKVNTTLQTLKLIGLQQQQQQQNN